MAVEPWPIVEVAGVSYYQVEGFTRIEVDPTGDVYFLVRTPEGGVGSVGPLVQGDPGPHTEFSTTVDLTVLDYDDPAPDDASIIELVPGGGDTAQVVKLALTLHQGPKGDDGDTILTPEDYGVAVAGKTLELDATATDFVLVTPKVGDRYIPAVLNNTPSGNPTYTLGVVSIPAQDFDWRPQVHASCEITGTGTDVSVDLLARLGTTGVINPETAGNIVGRALGSAGQYPPVHILTPGPDAGSADSYDKVLAGNPAQIYLRAERQTGADTFTTTSARTRFWVKVDPVPGATVEEEGSGSS